MHAERNVFARYAILTVAAIPQVWESEGNNLEIGDLRSFLDSFEAGSTECEKVYIISSRYLELLTFHDLRKEFSLYCRE